MFATNYTGGQLVYPLLYDYPEDDECLNNIESTYMLGDAIKVSPRIDPKQENNNMTTFKSYFPQGIWRDLHNWSQSINASAGGAYFNLTKVDGQTPIHMKAGKIIPQQFFNQSTGDKTSHAFESTTTSIVINPDESLYADGYMLIDDGSSQD